MATLGILTLGSTWEDMLRWSTTGSFETGIELLDLLSPEQFLLVVIFAFWISVLIYLLRKVNDE